MLIALGLVQSRVHPNKTNTSCLKSSEFVGTTFYPTTHLSYHLMNQEKYLEFCETYIVNIKHITADWEFVNYSGEIFTRIVNEFPVGSYMFNVNNRNIRTSTANGVFIVNFEHEIAGQLFGQKTSVVDIWQGPRYVCVNGCLPEKVDNKHYNQIYSFCLNWVIFAKQQNIMSKMSKILLYFASY